MSAITRGYPSCIMAGGRSVTVETGFRYWLEVSEILEDDDLSNGERIGYVFELLGIDPDASLLDGLLDFLRCGRKPKRGGSGKRAFDYAYDDAEIIASFLMDYGIDLTDPSVDMHWWMFCALLNGLSDRTPFKRLVKLRTMEPPEGRNRAEFLRAQRDIALPAKTFEERIQRDEEIWGDAWMAP